jgi:protein SCO1/2
MNGSMTRRAGISLLGVALGAAVGCHETPVKAGRIDVGPESVGPTYRLRGVVLGKSSKMQEITVHQQVIRDFEPAMNEVYRIGDTRLFNRLNPGDQISGKVIPSSDGIVNGLEDVAIISRPGEAVETMLPPHRLLLGEDVPQIPMVDQDGRTVEFASYSGKTILITFIDSKCTDDCPILSRRFERINSLLAADGKAYAVSHLISISIDPAADTPPVLRKYGLSYLDGKASGFSHWEFTDATPANLKRLATAFGVVYRENHGDIDHNMQTALIGPDGKLVQVWGGDEWNPSELAKAVEKVALHAGSA